MILNAKQLKAIHDLYPQVAVTRGGEAFDIDGNPVAYDINVIQAHVDANKYKELRASEYPSFADQFDTIFHEGLDTWKAQIQAVKDKYPKGATK